MLTVLPLAGEHAALPPKMGASGPVLEDEAAAVPPVEPPVEEPVEPPLTAPVEEPPPLAVPVDAVPVEPVAVVPVLPVAPDPVVPLAAVDPVLPVVPVLPPPVTAAPPVLPPPAAAPEASPLLVSVWVPEPVPALRISLEDNLVPHPATRSRALAARQVDVVQPDLVREPVGRRLLFMDPPMGLSPAARTCVLLRSGPDAQREDDGTLT
ncbi:MAG: hypothetical protein ACXVGH_01340, partial [Mycobacteriales bacterium]